MYRISFLDPPGAPEIEGYTQGEAIRKGDLVTLVCLSYGGNPLATLTWYRNAKRVDSSYTAVRNGSRNSYEFRAEAADNGAVFSCQAKNDLIESPLVAEITTTVQCEYSDGIV
jgi:nephron